MFYYANAKKQGSGHNFQVWLHIPGQSDQIEVEFLASSAVADRLAKSLTYKLAKLRPAS